MCYKICKMRSIDSVPVNLKNTEDRQKESKQNA